MITLYIDTHMEYLVLGLIKNEKLLAKKVLKSNKHSEHTINLLNEIMTENNLDFADLSEIIVINGPGSFTGVRIGVVIAKIIGYTKNIKVKPISYLQALSLSYNEDATIGIKDKNGIYGASFNKDHELINDYFYVNNYDDEIIIKGDDEVDILKVYEFLKTKPDINIHLLKPLYVKNIEVKHD